MTTALRTDHYELTMVDAALRSGVAHHRATFEVFARQLPPGRRYGVVAGVGRLAEAVGAFRFGDAELAFLESLGAFSDRALAWLAGYRFSGSIDGYAEGELYFPGSPVLTVEAPFAEALVLETLVLSILNFDSAVASAAARMHVAAAGRALVEMGGRRTNEDAAVAAARAAYVAGFDATSNLEAGRRYGIPTIGTVAHAFVLAHATEKDAFAAEVAALGPSSTVLVDTYDIADGIRTAVEVSGPDRLGAIRIDSGDLGVEAERARRLLDELGATGTRIVLTGDLDEHRLVELAACPADAYGVGTALVTGSGAPTALFVYKLVEIDRGDGPRPVEKRSPGKATQGGRKQAWRLLDAGGSAVAERLTGRTGAAPVGGARRLQVPVIRSGEPAPTTALGDARAHHLAARAELAAEHLDVRPGLPALVATHSPHGGATT